MATKRVSLITLGRHLQTIPMVVEDWADRFPSHFPPAKILEGLHLMREDIRDAVGQLRDLDLPDVVHVMTTLIAVDEKCAEAYMFIEHATPEQRDEAVDAAKQTFENIRAEYERPLTIAGYEMIARAELLTPRSKANQNRRKKPGPKEQPDEVIEAELRRLATHYIDHGHTKPPAIAQVRDDMKIKPKTSYTRISPMWKRISDEMFPKVESLRVP